MIHAAQMIVVRMIRSVKIAVIPMLNEYALGKMAEAKVKEMEQYFGLRDSRKKARLNIRLANLFKIKQQQPDCCCC
jgi:hypothetical protein